MAKGYTQEEFKSLCDKVHNNKYDYSSMVYTKIDEDIEVICPSHGKFRIRAQDHIYPKLGCKECSSEVRRGKQLISHIQKVKNMHGDKYTVHDSTSFKDLRTTLTFNCKDHGNYESSLIGVKLSKLGNCPHCKRVKSGNEFIKKATGKHKGKYVYNVDNYTNSRTCMDIWCTVHDKNFSQRPSMHIQGQGCPDCGDESRIETKTKSTLDFIRQSKELYPNQYKYDQTKYLKSHEDITLSCAIADHPDFITKPSNHLSGQGGCIICSQGKILQNHKEAFISNSKTLYPHRLDYSKVVYINNSTKVSLVCKEHNCEFNIKPNHHIDSNRFGCPECGVLNLGRWNIQSVRKIPHIESRKGYLYLGIVSGLRGFKLGVCGKLSERLSCYNTDFRGVENNFNYIRVSKLDYVTAYTVEYILKRVFNKYKVAHNLKFGGKNEMFDLPNKELNFMHDLLNGKHDLLVNYFRQEFVTTKQDYTKVIDIVNKLVEED